MLDKNQVNKAEDAAIRQDALEKQVKELTDKLMAVSGMVSAQAAGFGNQMDMRVVNPLAVMIKNPSPEPLYKELGLTPETMPHNGQCYGYKEANGKWVYLMDDKGHKTQFANLIKVISLNELPPEQSALSASPDKSPTVSFISNGLNEVGQEKWTAYPSRISIRAWVGMVKTHNMGIYEVKA